MGVLCPFAEVDVKLKKGFSVIFLILLLCFTFCAFIACEGKTSDSPITDIIINTFPKTNYYLGDLFDIGDAKITVIHENGDTESIPMDINMVSGFNSNVVGDQQLSVRYETASVFFTVKVSYPPVYSLEVNSTTHKTEYVVGQELDTTDLTMLVRYTNGRSATVTVDNDMVGGFSSATPGEKVVVISYQGHTCNLPLNVVPRSVANVQLRAPTKANYIVGDDVDFTGGSMFVSYNDNSTQNFDLKTLIDEKEASVIVSGEDDIHLTKSQLACTVTVYYLGMEHPFVITIEDMKATAAAVTKELDDQVMGSSDFNFASGEITVTYNNGSVKALRFDDSAVSIDTSGCDLGSVGDYKANVSVGGVLFKYTIHVVSPQPKELLINQTVNSIYQGGSFDVTKWKYSILLNNGQLQRSGDMVEFFINENMLLTDLSTFDLYKVGSNVIRFRESTSGLTAEANIEVLAKEVTEVIVENEGRSVYSEGDALNMENVYAYAVYNNGDVGQRFSVTKGMLFDEDSNPLNEEELLADVGDERKTEKTIYVHYSDRTFDTSGIGSYKITLVKKASSIELLEEPKDYYILGEQIDKNEFQIKINFAEGTTTTVTGESGALDGSEWKIEYFLHTDTEGSKYCKSLDDEGRYSVVITYGESVSLQYEISVVNNVVGINLNIVTVGFVTERTEPDLTDANMYVLRENGSIETEIVDRYMMSDGYTVPAYRSIGTEYVSAYLDATVLAWTAKGNGFWNDLYPNLVVATENGYEQATSEYSVESDYYYNFAKVCADKNWNEYKYYFYEDENGTRAGEYSDEKEYYLNNVYEITFSYMEYEARAYAFVVPKQIVSVTVSDYKEEYEVTEDDWDYEAFRLSVYYNNGTYGIVSGATGTEFNALVKQGADLYYTFNGMKYDVELGRMVEGEFAPYDFSDFKVMDVNDMLKADKVFFKVKDAATGEFILSSEMNVYCFEELIDSINVIAGERSGSDLVVYSNQSAYLNEGMSLFEKGFVLDETNTKKPIADNIFVCIKGQEGSITYMSLAEAREASATSFSLSDYSQTTLNQTITVGLLRKQANFGLVIRPNVISYVNVEKTGDDITVIEKMNIDPSKVSITVGYNDADGVFVGERAVDFRQARCEGYSKTMDWNFGNASSVQTTISIGYGDYPIMQEFELTVLRKELVSITMTSMPRLVYVEDPTGNTHMGTNEYAGGKVSLRFNNGTTQILDLANGSLNKNPGNFDAEVMEELTNGSQKQHTIYVSYNYFGTVKQTSYNVVIVDRKNISIEYDSILGYDKTLVCEYGASESIFPMPRLWYYENYSDIVMTAMTRGENNAIGKFFVRYRNEQGELSEEWPTEVGTYAVVISYFEGQGDASNNAFFDDSAKIRINKKELAVIIDDYTVTYGDIIDGDNDTAFAATIGWRMTGVANGIADGPAYCYDDTDADVIRKIELHVYSTASVKQEFIVYTIGDLKKLVINIPAGEYVVKPEITFVDDCNYIESALISATRAKFTVEKRKIFVVAENAQKTYGQADPDFGFRIYQQSDIASRFVGEDISSLEATRIFEKENDGLLPIGNKSGIYYVYGDNNYIGNGRFNVLATNIVFGDRTTREYHLARSAEDTNNAGEAHVIYSGANEILSNYDVTYIKNYLVINKAELPISFTSLSRYFGTELFVESGDNYFVYNPLNASYVMRGDTFSALTENFFDDMGQLFYYEKSTGIVTIDAPAFFDGWCVLYKNVKIYSDRNCAALAGTVLDDFVFSINDVNYEGNYFAFPLDAAAQEYYVVADTSNFVLTNYIPSVVREDGEAFDFVLEVKKTNVKLNVESMVASGNGSIKDQNNASNGRLLASYFVGEDFVVEYVNKNTFDATVDETFKNMILNISYLSDSGEELDYRLKDDTLQTEYIFERENTAFNTGIHTVYATTTGNDFNISLESIVSHGEEIPYVNFYYEYWNSVFGLDPIVGDYSQNAYVVLLPEFIKMEFGNAMTVENETVSFGRKEVYSNRAKTDFIANGVNGYATLNGTTYTQFTESGVTYSITNANATLQAQTRMYVDDYVGTATYSFFDSDTKNYVYLGNSMILESTASSGILNYIFNGTDYHGQANKPLTYSSNFAYKVEKVELAFYVSDLSENYMEAEDFVGYAVDVVTTDEAGSIIAGDLVNLYFDVTVRYNQKEEQTNSNIGLNRYRLNNDDASSGDFTLYNAGVYQIKVTGLSNDNYAIKISNTGTVTISSINIPVYIDYSDNDGLDTVITMNYQANANGINPLDTVWKKSTDPRNAAYCYITTTCYIVKDYRNNGINYTCDLSFIPSIIVSTAQRSVNANGEEEWNYPKYVRRDDEGNVIGYPITARVTNTEYINYDVVFVYKNGGVFEQFADGDGYTLIINPQTARLYGFANVNAKAYDGMPASVRANDSALTITGDFNADPIDRNGIIFDFERPTSEMYVGSNQYLTDSSDITNVGKLKVKIRYLDANGNMNYNIVFADQEVQYVDDEGYHNDIGTYKIMPGVLTFDLKNVANAWVTKQFDGKGFVNASGVTGTANGLTLYGNQDAIDDLSEMYYAFEVKGYAIPTDYDSLITTDITTLIKTSSYTTTIPTAYDVGYYWIDLYGLYKNEEGEFVRFDDGSRERKDWLSWNYRFEIQSPTNNRIDYKGCDGIYYVAPRDVYIAINPTETGDSGVLQVKEGDINAPVYAPTQTTYTYSITYDGYRYKGTPTSAELSQGNYVALMAALNGSSNIPNKQFTYGFYAYDENEKTFTNINKIDALRPTAATPSNIFEIVSNNYLETGSDPGITSQITSFTSNNRNLNVINAGTGHGINFKIVARELPLKISLLGIQSGEAKIVYGTEFADNDGLYFKIEYAGDYEATGIYDAKLASVENIINQIINASGGSLRLREIDAETSRISIAINAASTSFIEMGDVRFVRIGGRTMSALPANRYDNDNNAIPRYETMGTDLAADTTRYAVRIVSTEFTITRKEITLTGVTRKYFDKDTDNYVFTVAGNEIGEETANALLDELDDNQFKVKDFINDASSIASGVGTWSTNEKRINYYVAIPVSRFNVLNTNYILKTEETINNFDVQNWNGKSVRTASFVYLPLEIEKAVISIKYIVANEVEYGDVISANKGEIQYNGLPTLNAQGIYTHINHSTGERISETDIYNTDRFSSSDAPITLQDERSNFISTITQTLIYDKIYELIALSNVKDSAYAVPLDESMYYISNTPVFDNFEVSWSSIDYKIIKKQVELSMAVKVRTYNNGSSATFNARWSERSDFFYAGEGYDEHDTRDRRLGYTISISDFSVNNVAIGTLSEKIAMIMGATYDSATGSITYNNQTYSTVYDFMNVILDYKIFVESTIEKGDEDEEAQSGAIIRYIGLYGLTSANYDLKCVRSPIMLYPEIEGIGAYTYTTREGNEEVVKYANLIADTEASSRGVSIDDDGVVTGLSILVRYNFIGLGEQGAINYIDTNRSDDYSTSNYNGMTYDRKLTITYLPEFSSFTYSKDNLRNGDKLAIKLTLKEVFYDNSEYKHEMIIESNCITVSLKDVGNSEAGYVETLLDKSDERLRNISNSVETLSSYLQNTDGKYYLSNENGVDYKLLQDIINLRLRLVPVGVGSGDREIGIILYENDFGTLKLAFNADSAYLRIDYNNYYIAAVNNYKGIGEGEIMRKDDEATYYSFDAVTSLTVGDDISDKTYYERVGNGFILSEDDEVIEGKAYYVRNEETGLGTDLSSVADNIYVSYNVNMISDNIVSLFDGKNHSFNIYLDKVGAFDNARYTVNESTAYNLAICVGDPIPANTLYELINGEYVFTEDTAIQEGKTYYGKDKVGMKAEIKVGATVPSGIYYESVGSSYVLTQDETFVSGKEYYVRSKINSLNVVADRIMSVRVRVDNTDYVFTYTGEPYAFNHTEVEYEGTGYSSYETTSLYKEKFFTMTGRTGLQITNLKAMVSKYTLQTRKISTATIRNNVYIANVVFWPIDNEDVPYITNSGTALTIAQLLSKVGNVTISGGEEALTAYNYASNGSKAITDISETRDITNNITGVSMTPGMYTMSIESTYSYGEDAYSIGKNTVRVIVVDSQPQKQLNLNSNPVQSNNPLALSSGYYFTGNMQTEMTGNNSVTYVFDNVNLSGSMNGNIWIYFKLSNKNFTNLYAQNDELGSVVGLAMRIRVVSDSLAYANLIYSQQVLDDDEDVRFTYWTGEEKQISFNSSNITIIKIDVARIDEELNTGSAIAKNDRGELLYQDIVVSFRMYQHSDVSTDLVFEDYFRDGFGRSNTSDATTISRLEFEPALFGSSVSHYLGIGLDNISIRLLDMYKDNDLVTDVDYVKLGKDFTYKTIDDEQKKDKLSGEYVARREIFDEQDVLYVATDKYDVPYAYNGNTVSIRFKVDPKDDQIASGGFAFYFGMNTPYYTMGGSSDVRRQRGLMLEYKDNSLSLTFYKYTTKFKAQTVNIENGNSGYRINFFDGQEHTITMYLDTNVIMQHEGTLLPRETYVLRVFVDELAEADVEVPVGNNLKGLEDYMGSPASDSEQEKIPGADLMFFKGTYYMGFEVYANTALDVTDCVAFDQENLF